jgi:hypothetical protein
MDISEIDKTIKKAKLWIQQNRPPYEDHFWVDGKEVVHKCPPGTCYNYETGRFVPLKK